MTVDQAIKKLQAGQSIQVPDQISWRRADQIVARGLGVLDYFQNRWRATLRPVS